MSLRFSLLTAGLLLLTALPMQPPTVQACAAAWGRDGRPVAIVDESAIILWDAAQKVQHFIRWARFDASAPDFGFLVPTPTQPQLSEVSAEIFTTLEEWTAPKVVKQGEWNFEPMLCIIGCAMQAPVDSKMADKAAPVRVLDRQTVGGQDVAVLEADNAEALRQWLDKHGYDARPELTAWLAPYIAQKWKITAFKIAQPSPGNPAVQTAPVRMSFRTDRPFFPYREPAESKDTKNHPGHRLLRVFFVGTQRVQGMLGEALWSANVRWSNALAEARQAELMTDLGLPPDTLSAGARLTVFDDTSSPRQGSDEVWFEPSASQDNILPPDRVERYRIWIPLDAVVLGILLIGLLVYANRRSKKLSQPNMS